MEGDRVDQAGDLGDASAGVVDLIHGRAGVLHDLLATPEGEEVFEATVRYRTVGDATCTAAVESTAVTVEEVIAEVSASRITERGATRADDKFSEAAMEDRKREGYF